MTCIGLPGGGIGCMRGKRKISAEALARDLEIIAQFEQDMKEGKYDRNHSKG